MTQPKPPSNQVDRIIAPVRFVAVLGILASISLSTLLFLSSAAYVVRLVIRQLGLQGEEESLHTLVLAAVEQADILLIATALLIVAFGLYGLFVNAHASLPQWLRITTVDELKSKLLGVVVVAMAVRFFAMVYEYSGADNLLTVGGGIAVVILALAAFSFAQAAEHAHHDETPGE